MANLLHTKNKMSPQQQIDFYKEYMAVLMTDPLNLPVWWMLQVKFMLPAMLIARNDSMEEFIKTYSLNGIKSNLGNMCKPY